MQLNLKNQESIDFLSTLIGKLSNRAVDEQNPYDGEADNVIPVAAGFPSTTFSSREPKGLFFLFPPSLLIYNDIPNFPMCFFENIVFSYGGEHHKGLITINPTSMKKGFLQELNPLLVRIPVPPEIREFKSNPTGYFNIHYRISNVIPQYDVKVNFCVPHLKERMEEELSKHLSFMPEEIITMMTRTLPPDKFYVEIWEASKDRTFVSQIRRNILNMY